MKTCKSSHLLAYKYYILIFFVKNSYLFYY